MIRQFIDNKPFALAFLAFVGSWVYLYLPHFQTLYGRWNQDDTSYCFLVPLISAYLIYEERDRLFLRSGQKAWVGYAALFCSTLFFVVGRLGSLETFVYVSMWLTIVACLAFLLNPGSFARVRFALLVLLFMVPPPPFLNRLLSFKLKLASTALATNMLELFSIPAYREGNVIDLGLMQLEVVNACSGLRYFIPTLLLSLLIGYFFHNRVWKRVLLLVLGLPVSVIANAFRIAITGVLVRVLSPEMAEGFFHDFSGWLVYVISIALLLGLSWALRRIGPKAVGEEKNVDSEPVGPVGAGWSRFLVAGAALLAVAFFSAHLVTVQTETARKSFNEFPMQLGQWEGERQYLDQGILKALWADDYVKARFRNRETNDFVHLLVSYYAWQTTQHTAHAPASCFIGGGWELDDKHVLPPGKGTGRDFPVQRMVLTKGKSNVVANFWFQQRGRLITSEYLNKLYLVLDSIFMKRSDGALVRVEMILRPDQTPDEAQRVLDGFIAELAAVLPEYVPGEAAGR